MNTIREFYSGRSDALEIAKDHGVRGGVVVAHGYRVLDETVEAYAAADPDCGIWVWLRENETDWKEQVYWSPHYHVIGLAVDVEPGDEDRDRGWIFENIRSLAPYEGARDRDAYHDMAGAVRYLLSHATFPAEEDRHAVTWFGALHNSNFSPDEELSDGAWSLIQRVAEEVVGGEIEAEEEGSGRQECSHEDCDSRIISIWRAPTWIMDDWSAEQQQRVVKAHDWASGRAVPPPGLKNPRTIEEAEEAIGAL